MFFEVVGFFTVLATIMASWLCRLQRLTDYPVAVNTACRAILSPNLDHHPRPSNCSNAYQYYLTNRPFSTSSKYQGNHSPGTSPLRGNIYAPSPVSLETHPRQHDSFSHVQNTTWGLLYLNRTNQIVLLHASLVVVKRTPLSNQCFA